MASIVRRAVTVTSLQLRYLDEKPITVYVEGKYSTEPIMRRKARKALKNMIDNGKIAKDSIWVERVKNFDFAIGEHVTVLHHYVMNLSDFIANAKDFKPVQVNE